MFQLILKFEIIDCNLIDSFATLRVKLDVIVKVATRVDPLPLLSFTLRHRLLRLTLLLFLSFFFISYLYGLPL